MQVPARQAGQTPRTLSRARALQTCICPSHPRDQYQERARLLPMHRTDVVLQTSGTYVRYPLPLSMFRDMDCYISISHKSQSVLSGVSERNYILSPHPTVALASHITIQHTNNYPLLNIHAVLRHLPFYRGFRNKRGISSASTFTQSPCCLL